MKNIVLASLLALAGGILGATPLSVLVAGGSLSAGGITISNFSFVRNCSGVGVCAPGDASDIDVTLSNGHIQFAGGFTALSVDGFSTADFLIGYDLLSTYAIREIGLLFNGAVVGDQSFAQVVETVLVPGPFIAGQGQVDAPGGPLSTIITLDQDRNFMRIVKDIFLVGSDTEGLGYSSISYVDQVYPVGDVPEPATYAMIAAGLVGLALKRR